MTREEAISILSRPRTMKNTPSDILEAHEMAIKALEQQHCTDAISRQAAIDSVRAGVLSTATLYGRTEEGETARREIERLINTLLSVTCSEKPNRCEDAISRSEAIRVASGYCHWSNIPEELAKLPSVSVAEKVGTDHWEKLWDELYDWLNDTRLNVAPDETVEDDVERHERLAQADMLDEVMECMLDLESRREEGETDG